MRDGRSATGQPPPATGLQKDALLSTGTLSHEPTPPSCRNGLHGASRRQAAGPSSYPGPASLRSARSRTGPACLHNPGALTIAPGAVLAPRPHPLHRNQRLPRATPVPRPAIEPARTNLADASAAEDHRRQWGRPRSGYQAAAPEVSDLGTTTECGSVCRRCVTRRKGRGLSGGNGSLRAEVLMQDGSFTQNPTNRASGLEVVNTVTTPSVS